MLKQKEFQKILRSVRVPAQYIGQEENSIHKTEPVEITCCLCYPDKYEIGMSNLGLNILYFRGNALPQAAVERAFLPEEDMLARLKEKNIPLFALESQRPLKEFNVVGFSLQHELTYTNVLLFLDRAAIPLLSVQRGENDPLIFVGGPCAFNPEPLADFIDVALIGEGEELFEDFLQILADPQVKKLSREKKLEHLAGLERAGIYIPARRNKTTKNYIKDLAALHNPVKNIIPYIDTVHNRLVLEIMRGCLHGCRFCQAGFTWRPLRPRKAEQILQDAEHGLRESGYTEISLLSLTATDHPEIEDIACALNEKYLTQKINISLPSLRTESISEKLLAETQKIRHSTITIAPEAGTQRLRDIIHKEMSEADILKAAQTALASKIRSLKLYFILGLPGETDEDVLAIPALAEKILKLASASRLRSTAEADALSDTKRAPSEVEGRNRNKNFTITISASNFVPKPHTPFQWAAVNAPEEIKRKQNLIKQNLKSRRIQFRYHQAEPSAIEAVLSRGGRELGTLILTAYKLGCQYDAWQEHFRYDLWQEAIKQCGKKLEDFLRPLNTEQELPWDNIGTLVPRSYLLKEYNIAISAPI